MASLTVASASAVLTAPFWWSAISKLAHFRGAIAEASVLGLRPAGLVAVATIAVQLGGSALIVTGQSVWIGAGLLAAFTLLASLVGHAFWTCADPVERDHQLNAFLANVGLVGGLALTVLLSERVSA
jgi:transmembrane protein